MLNTCPQLQVLVCVRLKRGHKPLMAWVSQGCHSKSPKSEIKALTDAIFSLSPLCDLVCLSPHCVLIHLCCLCVSKFPFFLFYTHFMYNVFAHATRSFGGQRTWSNGSWPSLRVQHLHSLRHLASPFISFWDRVFPCSLSWLWTLDSLTSASECWAMPSRFPLRKTPIICD